MTDPTKPPLKTPPAGTPVRRATDTTPPHGAGPVIDDPEVWYRDLRSGARTPAQIALITPLGVIFTWHAQRRISEIEFAALMAALDVQEVLVAELAPTQSGGVEESQQRSAVFVAALRQRLSALDHTTVKDALSQDDLRAVLEAKQPMPDGIGIHMLFVSPAMPPEGSSPLPPPSTPLNVHCRAYVGSASMRSAVKCEAVFSSPALPNEIYCRILLPLPVVKGGRRRLFVSVLDNETRQPVNLPPPVAELFQEKFIHELKILRKHPPESSGLGDLFRGTFGRLLGK